MGRKPAESRRFLAGVNQAVVVCVTGNASERIRGHREHDRRSNLVLRRERD